MASPNSLLEKSRGRTRPSVRAPDLSVDAGLDYLRSGTTNQTHDQAVSREGVLSAGVKKCFEFGEWDADPVCVNPKRHQALPTVWGASIGGMETGTERRTRTKGPRPGCCWLGSHFHISRVMEDNLTCIQFGDWSWCIAPLHMGVNRVWY